MAETNAQDICQRLEEMTRQIVCLRECYVTLHNYLIVPGNFDYHIKKALSHIFGAADRIREAASKAKEQFVDAKKQLDASEFSELLREMRSFQIYVGNRFKEFGEKLNKIEERDFQKVRIQIDCDSPTESKQDVVAVTPKKRGRPTKNKKGRK
jgi:uncharacterized coiled-coil DUF342 family protein